MRMPADYEKGIITVSVNNDMHVTQDLNSFGEIIAHAHCSVDEKKNIYIPCVPHKDNCKKKLVHTT